MWNFNRVMKMNPYMCWRIEITLKYYSSDRENVDETVSTDYRLPNPFSRKVLPSFDDLISPPDGKNSAMCSCANNILVLGASPRPDSYNPGEVV